MPVSSSTSRTAACSAVSPCSTCPLGSDQRIRPRRSIRPISAPPCGRSSVSTTSPPAEVSSTRRHPGRRGRAMPSIVSVGRHSYRTAGRPAGRRRGRPAGRRRLDGRVRRPCLPSRCRVTSPADLVPVPRGRRPPRPPVFAARRPRAAPGRRLGPRRAARPARRRPRLRHRRPPGADAGAGHGLGRRDLGRPASSSAPIGVQERGLRLEITTFRAEAYDGVTRNPVVAYGDSLARRPAPARLHGQRDGRLAAGTRRSPTRTAGWRDLAARVLRTPADAARVVRRRPAADAAGRPVRRPARLHRRRRTWSRR